MADYSYKKLLADKNIKIADLPEEVQVAIEAIIDIDKGLNITQKAKEKAGKEFSISDKTKKKIKAFDGLAVRGIQEFLDGKEVTIEAPTVAAVETIIAEVKAENTPDVPPVVETVAPVVLEVPEEKPKPSNTVGVTIESELAELNKSGVSNISLSDLKSKAPSCYKVIFENYNESEENGIETTNFKLLENDKKEYTLTKK